MRPARLALLALLLFAFSCSGGDSSSTPTGPSGSDVARIEVTPASQTISYGETLQLSAKAYNSDGQTVTVNITWSSSASDIASVSNTGLVTTKGVGDVTITASTGSTAASATVTVQVAQYALTANDASAPPFQVLTLSLPGGVDRPAAGTTLDATLGSTAAVVVVDAQGNLGLEVPDVAAGQYDLTVKLSEYTEATAQITVEQAPVVSNPDSVVSDATTKVTQAVDSLTSVGVGSSGDLAVVTAAVGAVNSWYGAASDSDKVELARYLAVNGDIISLAQAIAIPGVMRSAGPSTVDSYTDHEEDLLTTPLDAMEELLAQTTATHLPACKDGGYGSWECGVVAITATTLTLDLLRGLPIATRLSGDPLLPAGSFSVYPAGSPSATPPIEFPSGAPVNVRVSAETRSVNSGDLGGSGAAGSIAGAVDRYDTFWSSVETFLGEAGPLLNETFTLSGSAPTLASESTTATLPVVASALTLGTISANTVSCTKAEGGVDLILTCSTQESTDQSFDFDLAYASSALSATITTAGLVKTAVDPCAIQGELVVGGPSISGSIADGDCLDSDNAAYDAYSFTLGSESSIRFDATGTGDGYEPHIDVWTSTGKVLFGDGGNPELTRAVLPAGSYVARVYDNSGQATGDYTVSLSSDPNTADGCGRQYYIYFGGHVTHSGSLTSEDCLDHTVVTANHWDGYFTYAADGETVTATVYLSGLGILSLWNNPDTPTYTPTQGGYVTVSVPAPQGGGWVSVYPLGDPSNNVHYTISLSVTGGSGGSGGSGASSVSPAPAAGAMPGPAGVGGPRQH